MAEEQVEILLVEDDPNDLKLALYALKQERIGNRVQIARDGEEALDFLFCQGAFAHRDPNHHPRLILLDLKLPKVCGLEVLNRLRADPRTRLLPVVILTSSKQEEDLVRSYRLGVNSYIQKPVDFDQFRNIVRQLGYYWMVVNQPPPEGARPA
jgi:two-component system response regulator